MYVILSVSEGSFPKSLQNLQEMILRHFVFQDDKTVSICNAPLMIRNERQLRPAVRGGRGYCASGRTFSLVFPEKIAYNGY